ncbi:MAG: efflux RND transporter permease subunit [Pseudochelatococcus sp.]|jgi:HAE1 family hydrophobic/amphiphilic exporter-1|uniref:efflux RND transporter permease subunit n=1 Tax=Pseudochelatococcus sp. TaxID=2020869 RepID=UPI003D9394FA
MFNISAWAIRRPIPSIVLFVVLMLLGWSAFQGLPVARAPNIDMPLVTVTVERSGAAPEELEAEVTRPIENAVAGITGIKHIRSSIADGVSTTTVEFQLEVNSDAALFDVKNRVDALGNELPSDIDPPIVSKVDVEGQSLAIWSASSPDKSLADLSRLIDDRVAQRLRGIPGVGNVERIGGAPREIQIAFKTREMLALGLTVGDINTYLRTALSDYAAGSWEADVGRQPIRVLARARSVEDIRNTPLPADGRNLLLGDIADIIDTNADPSEFARLDGAQTVVAFSIYRARGADEVSVARATASALSDMQHEMPGVTFTRIDETTTATEDTFKAAMSTLIEGALLAVIVVFLFLRDWRATLVAAVALPLAIVPTFWVLALAGFSLNTISLLGITLVTGILVDDAIVEIENIERHMEMGKPPLQATIDATAEIGMAVMAISLSVAAVFAPVSFMTGVAGQYFKQFGLTVAVSVLFSLLVARLITPILAARFLNHNPKHEHRESRLGAVYGRLLRWTTRRKGLVIGASLGVFSLSIVASSQLPDDLIPLEDTGRLVFALEIPPGGDLGTLADATDTVARQLHAKVPDIHQILVRGGVAPNGARDARRATLIVRLKPHGERHRSQRVIQQEIRDHLRVSDDIRAWPLNDNGGREVEVSISSGDDSLLDSSVEALERRMRTLPQLTNVAAESGVKRTELHVIPRLDDASRLDVTTEQIATAVRLAAAGDIESLLPKMKDQDRLIPVRTRLDSAGRNDPEMLNSLPVARVDGMPIPLFAVADVTFRSGPSSIERLDRQRRVVIGADLGPNAALGGALAEVLASKEASSVPAGVVVGPTGDGEVMDEVTTGFVSALFLGVALMFAVLVLLFSGVREPIVILLSLPLSISGAVVALLLCNMAVSLPVLIGLLMLMGIVAKNAIMLVDFAQIGVKEGRSRADAIVHACQIRARPILMTTLAMCAGMVPSALGHGGGGGFRAPLAVSVIGGLALATLLTLITLPAFYLFVEKTADRIASLFKRRRSSTATADEEE